MDFPTLGASGGLFGILVSLLVLNFRALFRRDQQVWDLIEQYKTKVAELEKEVEQSHTMSEVWRDKYYDLLISRHSGTIGIGPILNPPKDPPE